MRLQNILFAAPAGGANAIVPINLEPGLCGLLIAAVFDLTAVGEAQAFVTIVESANPVSICSFGPALAAATVQQVNAGLDVGCSPPFLPLFMSTVGVGLSLPRVICQQNFSVTCGNALIVGGDVVSAGRLVVAFGQLWELLSI